jgi:maltose O-acetyltransferase
MIDVSSHKQRMLGGELYLASDPELVAERDRARRLVEEFNSTSTTENGKLTALLQRLLGAVGEDTEVMPPLQCDYGYPIRIGARCFVNYAATILDCAPVTIGDDVQIASGVQLLTATHPLDAAQRRQGWELAAPISIGDGAWLGGGVIVCPGVSIGENTVVGAGSVVIRDLPDGVLGVGNPCRVVRKL